MQVCSSKFKLDFPYMKHWDDVSLHNTLHKIHFRYRNLNVTLKPNYRSQSKSEGVVKTIVNACQRNLTLAVAFQFVSFCMIFKCEIHFNLIWMEVGSFRLFIKKSQWQGGVSGSSTFQGKCSKWKFKSMNSLFVILFPYSSSVASATK